MNSGKAKNTHVAASMALERERTRNGGDARSPQRDPSMPHRDRAAKPHIGYRRLTGGGSGGAAAANRQMDAGDAVMKRRGCRISTSYRDGFAGGRV